MSPNGQLNARSGVSQRSGGGDLVVVDTERCDGTGQFMHVEWDASIGRRGPWCGRRLADGVRPPRE
jgi:hypothetical protein